MLTSKSELLELAKTGSLTHEHIVELTQLGLRYLELMEQLKVTMNLKEPESITEMESHPQQMPPMTDPKTFKDLVNTDVRCTCGETGELRHTSSQGYHVYHTGGGLHHLNRKIKAGLKPSELALV